MIALAQEEDAQEQLREREPEEELNEEGDEVEDKLHYAARAGIQLIEKNKELFRENEALRHQVQALKSERTRLAEGLEQRTRELSIALNERQQSLLEVIHLQGELRAALQQTTTAIDREQWLMQQKVAVDAALAAAEDKVRVLCTLSTSDSNKQPAITLVEHEELLAKWQQVASENESLLVKLKSLKKELGAHKCRATKLEELVLRLEHVEKEATKLQLQNGGLTKDLSELRAVNESQRAMVAVYKKIADARTECTCALKWTEEVASYPTPLGDLNSPLMKWLLGNWTTVQSKIMLFIDWLHQAICGKTA